MGFVKVGEQVEKEDWSGGGRDPETGISGWVAGTTTTVYAIYAVYCDNCGSYNVREHQQGGAVYIPDADDPYLYSNEKDARNGIPLAKGEIPFRGVPVGVPYEVRRPRGQCLVCGQVIRDDVIFVRSIQNEDSATNSHRPLKLEYRRIRYAKDYVKREPHSLLERLFPPRPRHELRTFFVQSDAEEFDYDYVIQALKRKISQPHISGGLVIEGELLANPRHHTVASAENAPLKIRVEVNTSDYWEAQDSYTGTTGRRISRSKS